MVTQCMLYREAIGDKTYMEMEAALRDWLFGCNPWGTSMVVECRKVATTLSNRTLHTFLSVPAMQLANC